jgi:hypothetical protein
VDIRRRESDIFTSITLNNMSSTKESTNEPVRVFRAPGMSVAVFENTSDEGNTFHKLSAQRVYKVGKDYKTSTSFSLNEVPTLLLLMQRAWNYVSELENKAKDRAND